MRTTASARPRAISGLALACLIGAFTPSPLSAQPGPIPPQIQVILAKVKAHVPLSQAEQRAFQLWTARKANGTEAQDAPTSDESPAIPRDVQQILSRAQAGQLPSAAEKARLKAWAAQAQAHKAEIIRDAMTSKNLLQNAYRAGGSHATGPHPTRRAAGGTLRMDILQTVTTPTGEMTYTAKVSIPLLIRLKDDRDGQVPALHFQWWMNTLKQGTLDYRAHGWAEHTDPPGNCQPHKDFISASVKTTANALGGRLMSEGQIVTPRGRRSFIDATLRSMALGTFTVACQCGGVTRPAPPVLLPLTFDGSRGDVPFDFGAGYLPPVATPWMDRTPAEFRSMLDHATFDFDANALRQAMSKGGPFSASATYHWHLRTPTGESDSRTTFHFELQLPRPEVAGIEVNPDPPHRGDRVFIQAHVPGATHFHWTVTPRSAKPGTPPAPVFQSDADSLNFIALAGFRVSVQPSGGSGPLKTPPPREVTVLARPWKTAFIRAKVKYFVHPLMLAPENLNGNELQPDGDLHLGESACAIDEGSGNVQNRHWIHHPHGSTNFHFPVKKGGYEDAKVSSGPWAGYFYVKDQGLKVQRVRLINADLKQGSALWRINMKAAKSAPANKKPDIQALANEVQDHERAHDVLAFNALAKVDPAPKIENLIGTDEQALIQLANALCGDADSRLADAANHAHVKAMLMKKWGHSGYVLLPEPGGYRTVFILNYAELGCTPP